MNGTITIQYDRSDPDIDKKMERVGRDLPSLIQRMEGVGRIEIRTDNRIVYHPQEGLAVPIRATVVEV